METIEMIIEGIKLDESLRNIIVEREDCYISEKGEICISDPGKDFEQVSEILRNSTDAFNGSFFGLEPKIKHVSPTQISDVILHLKSDNKGIASTSNVENTEALKRLQRLLELAQLKNASDIHLRLNYDKKITEISGRIDGEFIELMGDQELAFGETVGFYAAVTLGKKHTFSQVTQVDCSFMLEIQVEQKDSQGKTTTITQNTKWRMSQIRIDEGTKVVFRSLQNGTQSKLPELGELGLTAGHVEAFVGAVNSAQGAIIMSGPTGSGKTTTINCSLQTIRPTRAVHSIEDPVEFTRPGRNHFSTAVNEAFVDEKSKTRTMSFEYYGRVLLRQDTDAVFFGEVRTEGAAEQFMRLATTGQVMLGTVHCNNSLSIITTIAEQFKVSITQLSTPGVLRALAHQRLVRKLCPECKIKHADAIDVAEKYNDPLLKQAIVNNKLIAEQEQRDLRDVCYRNTYNNQACKTCGGKGEKGRTALFEIIIVDDIAREFIRKMRLNEWNEHLKSLNWPSIVDHAKAKLLAGVVDYRSVTEQVDGLVQEDLKDIYSKMHMVTE